MEFLFGTGRISPSAFEKAFEVAASSIWNAKDIIKFLHSKKHVSPEALNKAFMATDNIDLIKVLYENESISEEAITTAFQRANFSYDTTDSKRARNHSDMERANNNNKRSRQCEEEFKSQVQEGNHEDKYKRLKDIPFPAGVLALPHVLARVDELSMSREEAVMEASKARDVIWLDKLLNIFYDDGQFDVTEAAVHAATNGHVDVVHLLLPKLVGSVPYAKVWGVFEAAAANGHLDVVKFAVAHADREDYWQTYKTYGRGRDALTQAVSEGHIDMVRYLLELHWFNWEIQNACCEAIRLENHDAVEILSEVFSDYAKGEDMFVELATYRESGCAQYLYKNGYATDELVNKAFARAAKDGPIDVVKFLFDTGRISPRTFDKAFKGAASSGWIGPETVKYLYSKKRPSTQVLEEAFEASSEAAVIQFLYKKKRVAAKSIIKVFRKAALYKSTKGISRRRNKDCIRTVKLLHKDGCIPSHLFMEAFLVAVRNRHTDVVEVLCDDDRISSEVMAEAFSLADILGDATLLKTLFNARKIIPDVVREILVDAAKNGKFGILKYLCAEGIVPQEHKHQALVAAAQHEQKEAVKEMTKLDDFPLAVLYAALNATQNEDIKDYLLEKIDREPFTDSK
ncbi:hypothetical protein PHYBOEH_011102 [Phytophthora boehmeriae]|uniref:Uncharacterized protein n=1 Tax=Phytophthora boehmeriae TaxID=109152 RepID=A0A8T1VK28_9STRA|nr:hypothetical protein PHYBOEH_011102 [Phytophthora boehmeriae]